MLQSYEKLQNYECIFLKKLICIEKKLYLCIVI